MSDSERPRREKRDKSVAYFWRALRYLAPHRRLVGISIGCAVLVGLTFTGGLSAMLPILRVLMNGETVQTWSGRIIAEKRLEIKLADTPDKVLIDHVHHEGAGAKAGLKQQDLLSGGGDAERTLAMLADPAATSAVVTVQRPAHPEQGSEVRVALPKLEWYYAAFYRGCDLLPRHPVKAIAAIFA